MYRRKILDVLYDHMDKNQVTVITGARQTGKTTIIEHLAERLQSEDKPVHLFTLEDPVLLNALNEHPDHIFRFIKETSQRIYIFVDEIQYLNNPSNFLKYIFDKYKNKLKLVVTGSSAFYIDRKFKDSLAGRKKIFELYTLDFEEFLVFKNQESLIEELAEIRRRGDYISPVRNLILPLFDEYLTYGGYPAVVKEDSNAGKLSVLQEIFSSYLKRDITESGVQNPDKFYSLIAILAHQTGSLLNINELANTLQISVTAVDNYIYILRKCYHIQLVKPFYSNIRKELTKMPKFYFNDNGFRNVIINQFDHIPLRPDRGILAENYTFIRLRQIYGSDMLRFWRTAAGNEVDFIIPENKTKGKAIEVKFNISEFRPSKYKLFQNAYPGFNLSCKAYMGNNNAEGLVGF